MLALRSRPEGPRGLGAPPKKASPTCATPRGVAGGDVILTLDQLLKRDGGGVGARAARPKETEPPNGRHKTKKKAACLSGVLEEIAKLSQDFSTYQEELRRKSNTSSPRSASSLSCACNGPETTPVATPSPPPTCTPTPDGHGPTEQMMNEMNTWLSFHLGVEEREEEEGEMEHECAAIPPTVPPRSTSIVGGHSSSPCSPRSSSSSRLMQLMMQQQQKPLDSRSSVEQQKQQQQQQQQKQQQQQQQKQQQQQHLDSRSHAEPKSLGRPVTLPASAPPRQGAAKSVGTVSRSSRSGRNRGSSSNGKSSSSSSISGISIISSGISGSSGISSSMKAPTTPELGSRTRRDGVCGRVGSADAASRGHPVNAGRADAMQGGESTGTLPPLQTRFSLPARPSKRRLPSRWAGRAPPESPDSGRQEPPSQQEPPSRQEPAARPAPKGARPPTACPPAPKVDRPPADSYNIHDIMDILSWGDLRSSAV
ncbi:AF4/FMR2 family member lilli-like [Lethenteron reissneri]|uniref:AF4/FMR2 family member lilli-like n=1 Tax=Lethenteron reissneri TaxID=7753 RepID=UPI002AB5F953|nr:AF4/FMR2 family member lilli-like [Lethenteron reissneri]